MLVWAANADDADNGTDPLEWRTCRVTQNTWKNNWLNSENKTIYLTKRKNAKHLQNNVLNSENFSRRHHHGLLVLSIIVIMDYHNSWQTLSTYLLLFVRWSSHQRRCHWCHCFPGRWRWRCRWQGILSIVKCIQGMLSIVKILKVQ